MAIRYYGSASDLNPAPFLAAASRTFNKSRVLLASRSNRVTSSTSPVPRASIAFVSAFRSATAPETEETLVPQWAKMADRMRGAHQRGQAATRSRSLPLQRLRRNEPLGWPRHYRRQRRQHRPRDRKAIKAVSSLSPLKLSNRPPVTPAGIALRLSIDRRSPKRNFAPGSRLVSSLGVSFVSRPSQSHYSPPPFSCDRPDPTSRP